ncbi:MAG TPA: molybdopterin cofactor-binding domain-containing protein [Abditibacteriaceae bacterium]|jgi:isoquinoline 1-oxidoreductase
MKEETVDELSLEPERYELYAELEQHWEAARREFFELVGGGIVVVYALDQVSGMHESSGRRGGPGLSLPQEIGAWLHISEEGQVTGYTGKVEVGQGNRTSLTQAIAEELPVPLASIQLVMGDTDLSPFDFGTVGSRTSGVVAPQMRKVAAAAREVLLDLAAQRLSVERDSLLVQNGKIIQEESGRAFALAELARGQKLLKAAGEEVLAKPATEWQVEATPVPKANGRAFVTGKHHYTSDFKRPGMLYGKVLRAPSMNARRISLDSSAAEAMPGVTVVCEDDFIGVAASDELAATRAMEAIHAEWKPLEGQPSTHELFDHFKKNLHEVQGFGGPTAHVEGSVEEGLSSANRVLDASYTAAYIAHAPLEPRAAVAEWSDEENSKLTVWTGTQRPFGVRGELAEVFGISEDRIRVIVPDTGSGYGGKHTGDAAIEAARLAKAAGKPVKLVWTREEEFSWAYFRPAGVIDIRSGVNADGTITAWEYHNYNAGAAGIRTLYNIPHQHIEFHSAQSPLRQGSYRALAATANHFARETHMDELAHAVGMEPLDFRLKNLQDERLRAVLEAAAERFGWGKVKPSSGHGFGIAGGHEKGSYVATCAEVAVEPEGGAVKVIRAVTAFECGAVINPDNLQNQIDGAVLMGLGGALFEGIHFEDGKILNARFSRYRVPRFSDVPILETVLLDRKDLPSVGAGETPIVAIAPAIGNAIFDATGVRLRSLPLAPDGVKKENS